MNGIYMIGDTHFGHKRVLVFEAGARSSNSIERHIGLTFVLLRAVYNRHVA